MLKLGAKFFYKKGLSFNRRNPEKTITTGFSRLEKSKAYYKIKKLLHDIAEFISNFTLFVWVQM